MGTMSNLCRGFIENLDRIINFDIILITHNYNLHLKFDYSQSNLLRGKNNVTLAIKNTKENQESNKLFLQH